MKLLNAHRDHPQFWNQLAGAGRRVLILDYDALGENEPGRQNLPCPTVQELLDCIMTTSRTRVILLAPPSTRKVHLWSTPGPKPEIWRGDGARRNVPSWYAGNEGPGSDDVSTALENFADDDAVAYYRAPGFVPAGAAPDPLVQFLLDWLRVCGGETC